MTPVNAFRYPALALGLGAAAALHAQTAPDAGQTLQQLRPPLSAPRQDAAVTVQTPTPAAAAPGGMQIGVSRLSFSGNTAIASDRLERALEDALGQTLDLAGLRALAERVTALYRANDYPFARAYLPQQDMSDGHLRIAVIEGRYGSVHTVSDEPGLALKAEPFLSSLASGAPITGAALERATLILDDLPGITSRPVIRPGRQDGTGDLEVRVARDRRFAGEVGLDNFGNRYTGQHRLRASVQLNSPFQFGDQLSAQLLQSDEQLTLGSIGYAWPLGAGGWRANLGYAQTAYVLGREFAGLKANGTATVTSAGVSYPLLRSRVANLSLSASFQTKELRDHKDIVNAHESKGSDSLPITLQFDRRDGWSGGGVTYGSFSWTGGVLRLDAALAAADANGTRGNFTKTNLELVRLQTLPGPFSLMARLSVQGASNNLDSSEKLSLGGANGVRAYPSGEANGDAVALGQIELRYAAGDWMPYAFFDAGHVQTNLRPQPGDDSNLRSLSGAGLGLRWQTMAWSADAALAWRIAGGAPQADTHSDSQPLAWFSLSSRF